MSQESGAGTVTFELNGKAVTVAKGTTVIQAAIQNGVKVPHFCYHEGLSVAGVCRFCMVEVEGRPKLEVSCNLAATDGMKVRTDSAKAQEAHKWALEFHLVNHPLDCPICDQAGECGLQDYYMSVGRYPSQMERPKVLKPKALDVGGDLVLDTERCILCSRCVRFEEEVTKTGALGIFDRGDRAIIGTYPGKKITHNYTANLVDICPVGAFTSRNFRFKQRVWFLEDQPSVCPGCSTGCHVDVYARPERRQYYRLKPRKSEANGSWMCDYGRTLYTHLNPQERLQIPVEIHKGPRDTRLHDALRNLARRVGECKPSEVALLVAPQYTNEEFQAFFRYFSKTRGIKDVFVWREPTEQRDAFDGVLLRGDRNSNSLGLEDALKQHGLKAQSWDDLAKATTITTVVALAPEIPQSFPSLASHLERLCKFQFVSIWTLLGSIGKIDAIAQKIPMKGFAEKGGTYISHGGRRQTFAPAFATTAMGARDVVECVDILEHGRDT